MKQYMETNEKLEVTREYKISKERWNLLSKEEIKNLKEGGYYNVEETLTILEDALVAAKETIVTPYEDTHSNPEGIEALLILALLKSFNLSGIAVLGSSLLEIVALEYLKACMLKGAQIVSNLAENTAADISGIVKMYNMLESVTDRH